MLRNRFFLCAWIVMAVVWATVATAQAGIEGRGSETRKAILLVAFGSTRPQAQVSFENIDTAVRRTWPDIPVRWAYTSSIVRKKLARNGRKLDSPAVALARMLDESITRVVVQSLHTIPGAEFHDLAQTARSFQRPGGFDRVIVGNALLATQADMEMAADAILGIIPAARKPQEAVVLMGHGTHHPANVYYAALMFQLQLRDPNLFVGCVEGYPQIGVIQGIMNRRKIRKAYLMPFMSVAGDHAIHDMAGEAPDSWRSILTQAGIECETILKGTAEYGSFVDIWVQHVQAAMDSF